jgi:hypothetical protein
MQTYKELKYYIIKAKYFFMLNLVLLGFKSIIPGMHISFKQD